MESEETQDVYDHYEKMLELLSAFERQMYQQWTAGVDEACSFNLNQPLITRNNSTNLIQVNFDHQVSDIVFISVGLSKRHSLFLCPTWLFARTALWGLYVSSWCETPPSSPFGPDPHHLGWTPPPRPG